MTARFRPIIATGAAIFWHPCEICGTMHAPHGFGVKLRSNETGKWYCTPHVPKIDVMEEKPPDERKGQLNLL